MQSAKVELERSEGKDTRLEGIMDSLRFEILAREKQEEVEYFPFLDHFVSPISPMATANRARLPRNSLVDTNPSILQSHRCKKQKLDDPT